MDIVIKDIEVKITLENNEGTLITNENLNLRFQQDIIKQLIIMYNGNESFLNFSDIVTRSNLKIEFDDDKKIITLQTPGENIIEINDEERSITITDQNGNTIQMSENGILLDSAKNIVLKAKGTIDINADMDINITGKTDLNLKAINIAAAADMALTARGAASAELSAAGQVMVKGAMVMIN